MNKKPKTAEAHSGVFNSYSEIPARYRLQTYTQHYQGENTLRRYLEEVYFPKHTPVSEWMQKNAGRVRRSWVDHMEQRGRHHALATPEDVDSWFEELLEQCSAETCYKTYFRRIFNFYQYLEHSYRHPHTYNPVLLAAINFESTRRIWKFRVKIRSQ